VETQAKECGLGSLARSGAAYARRPSTSNHDHQTETYITETFIAETYIAETYIAETFITENFIMTTPENNGLPAELEQLVQQDSGMGVSDNFADQLTPIVSVLQVNSPQCDIRGADYVIDAMPGKFWLRTSSPPIREWLDCICCGMLHVITEWQPDRAGFVGRHAALPDDVEITVDSSSGRHSYVRRGSRNVLLDTRETYFAIDGMLHMFPAVGTKHTVVRALETFFNGQRNPKTGAVLPSFAHRLRLTTTPRSNAKGKWYDVRFEKIGWPSLSQYNQAKLFTESVERGLQPLLAGSPVASIGGPKAA